MTRRIRFILAGAALALSLLAAGLFVSRHSAPPVVTAPNVAQRSELELRDGVLYRRGSVQPFEGQLVEFYAPGKQKLALEIHDGRIDGLSRGWHENGRLEVEEHFARGISQGPRTRWFENGQKRSEEQIVQGQQEGTYREWHENGTLALEMAMLHGQAEGLAQAWYPTGELKSRTEMRAGHVANRKFFPAPLVAAEAHP